MQPTKTDKKSYKRELAVVLLVWFAYLVETKSESLVELLVWPVFTYSALAFGLQWAAPNGRLLGNSSFETTDWRRSQYSSEYPSGQDQQPNHWHVERHRTKISPTSSQNNQPDFR